MEDGDSVPVPADVKRSDLPVRAVSALVMLAIAGTALWAGGMALVAFIALIARSLARRIRPLVMRATPRSAARRARLLARRYLHRAARRCALINFATLEICAILGVVIFTDIVCAIFPGERFGGPKIAPAIIPSKTWAGLIGAMVGAAGWSALVGYALPQIEVAPRLALAISRSGQSSGRGLAVLAQIGRLLRELAQAQSGRQGLLAPHSGSWRRV